MRPLVSSFVADIRARFGRSAESRVPRNMELADLPVEIKMHIVSCDARVGLRMMNVSRGWEAFVLQGPLRQLFLRCDGSSRKTREFIVAVRRAGRTPEHIFLCSMMLADPHVPAIRMTLVALGMLTPRLERAMSDYLIEQLVRPEVLPHALLREFPLITDKELSEPDLLTTKVEPPFCPNRVLCFGGGAIYYTDFHRLFFKIAKAGGEEGVVTCNLAQFAHAEHEARAGGQAGETARGDAIAIAQILNLWLSRESLKRMNRTGTRWPAFFYEQSLLNSSRSSRPSEADGDRGRRSRRSSGSEDCAIL